MAPKSKKPTTLNEQLALLDNPAPIDFDPEALGNEFSDGDAHGDSGSESGSDGEADNVDLAREHYVAVGKSRLRKQGPDLEALGEAYAGSRVDRSKLYDDDDEEEEEESGSEEEESEHEEEDDDEDEHDPNGVEVYSEDEEIPSDDAMGSGDEEKFGKWGFKGSRTTKGGRPPEAGDKVVGDSDEEDTEGGSEDSEEDSNSDQSGSGVSEDEEEEEGDESDIEEREELDKLLSNEQKTVSQTLLTARQRDLAKGTAIREQQQTFDALLAARIKLQRAITAVNALPVSLATADLPKSSISEAESAALSLFSTISTLRKRTHTEFTAETPTSELWSHLHSLESGSEKKRQLTLEKWSQKTQPVVVEKGKLDNKSKRSLTAAIRDTLSTDHEKLVNKTRGPDGNPEVFDDSDFYGMLLKALVDSRMVDGNAVSGEIRWAAAAQRKKQKMRKGKEVDTKASKGRKLRYTVHDRLVGFCAKMEGHDRWREEQIQELFGSLLGQSNGLKEEDEDMSDADDLVEEGGVRLFG